MKSLLLASVILMTISALDVTTSLKLKFCEDMRGHWAYDRLNLKHRCLDVVKKIGLKLCLDVIKKYALCKFITCKMIFFLNITYKK